MILVTPDGAPDDEHLPRRRAASAGERARRGADRARRDPLSRRLSVGPGDAALRDDPGDRGRPRGRAQGRLHPVRHLLHRPPPRRLQRADRRAAGSTSCSPTRPRSRRWPGCRTSTARSRRSRGKVETLVVTRSEQGALATRGGERADVAGRAGRASWSTRPAPATCSPPASSPARRAGSSLEQSLRLGAIAAAEVIQHYGARPEADLKALAGDCWLGLGPDRLGFAARRRAAHPRGRTAARRRRSRRWPLASSELCMP